MRRPPSHSSCSSSPQPARGQLVERAERLVEQHDVGVDRERARDREPLTLAARQRRGVRVAVVGQADGGEQLVDARIGDPGGACGQQHVLVRGDHSSSRGCWKTIPIDGAVPPARPSVPSETVPESARSRPATRLRIVVLPQPEGPTSATSSPASTRSEKPSSTSRRSSERARANVLRTSSTTIGALAYDRRPAPARDAPFDRPQEAVLEHRHRGGEQQRPGEHERDVLRAERLVELVADAARHAEHLDQHDHLPGEREAEARAAQQERRERRQPQLAQPG